MADEIQVRPARFVLLKLILFLYFLIGLYRDCSIDDGEAYSEECVNGSEELCHQELKHMLTVESTRAYERRAGWPLKCKANV